MSAGWVAGSVRARAFVRRRMGAAGTRRLAACPSLGDALQLLAATPYGANIRRGQALAAAQHEVARAVDAAEQQAAQTRERAAQRMPALVGRAVDAVRRLQPDDT